MISIPKIDDKLILCKKLKVSPRKDNFGRSLSPGIDNAPQLPPPLSFEASPSIVDTSILSAIKSPLYLNDDDVAPSMMETLSINTLHPQPLGKLTKFPTKPIKVIVSNVNKSPTSPRKAIPANEKAIQPVLMPFIPPPPIQIGFCFNPKKPMLYTDSFDDSRETTPIHRGSPTNSSKHSPTIEIRTSNKYNNNNNNYNNHQSFLHPEMNTDQQSTPSIVTMDAMNEIVRDMQLTSVLTTHSMDRPDPYYHLLDKVSKQHNMPATTTTAITTPTQSTRQQGNSLSRERKESQEGEPSKSGERGKEERKKQGKNGGVEDGERIPGIWYDDENGEEYYQYYYETIQKHLTATPASPGASPGGVHPTQHTTTTTTATQQSIVEAGEPIIFDDEEDSLVAPPIADIRMVPKRPKSTKTTNASSTPPVASTTTTRVSRGNANTTTSTGAEMSPPLQSVQQQQQQSVKPTLYMLSSALPFTLPPSNNTTTTTAATTTAGATATAITSSTVVESSTITVHIAVTSKSVIGVAATGNSSSSMVGIVDEEEERRRREKMELVRGLSILPQTNCVKGLHPPTTTATTSTVTSSAKKAIQHPQTTPQSVSSSSFQSPLKNRQLVPTTPIVS